MNLVSVFALGIPSTGRVKCLYIEKELIPAVWTVFLIFVITTVLNSTIIFVMVIASLMQMSGLEHLDANQKVKIVSANRGNTKVPGSILFCKNQTIDCTYVLLL